MIFNTVHFRKYTEGQDKGHLMIERTLKEAVMGKSMDQLRELLLT